MPANPSKRAMIFLVRRCKWQLEFVISRKQALYQLDGLAAFIAVEDVDLDPPAPFRGVGWRSETWRLGLRRGSHPCISRGQGCVY